MKRTKTVAGVLKQMRNLLMWFGLVVHALVITVVRDVNSMRPKNSVIARQRARRKKNKKAILFAKVCDYNTGNELSPIAFRDRTVLRSNGRLCVRHAVRVHVRWKHGEKVEDWEMTMGTFHSWDGASIPKFLQAVFGKPTQRSQWRPSFVHDFMYGDLVDREIADEAYLYLMQQEEALDISWLKESLVYAGVRLGGWTRYAVASTNPVKQFLASALMKWL